MLIPGEFPDALSSLRLSLRDGVSIRAAVAFVTRGGVEELKTVLNDVEVQALEVTARAADVTEPEALFALRDELGADVAVAIGKYARPFHPKIWLLEHAEGTVVISGSGNLTVGGMVRNDEQFEVLYFDAEDPAVAAQHERLDTLTRNAMALDTATKTAAWAAWMHLRKEQAAARTRWAHIERRYHNQDPLPDRSADKALLIEDLQKIYDDTVAADLPQADGRQYQPTRLLVAINRCRDGDRDPVKVVSDTIRRHTDGLDILLQAGRVDLTLEWLVVDANRPYYDLFSLNSVALAQARIDAFREAGHTIPDIGAPPRPAAVDVMSNEQIVDYLNALANRQEGEYLLPKLHSAQASLIKVEAGRASVRRDSQTIALIPVRLVRALLTDMAGDARPRVSELGAGSSDRFTAALGPLLAALPGVLFDEAEKRLYYDPAAANERLPSSGSNDR